VQGSAAPLPQEVEEGNVEYKLKLVNVTPERLEHLVTQMNWRLNEGSRQSDGRGEAVYQLGFEDSGHPLGLSDLELRSSLHTLRAMADAVDAYFTATSIQRGERGKVAQVVVRRRLQETSPPVEEVSLAAVGDAGVGKSTLAAVLATGELDNGRGLARMQVLRHNHELEEGHTSSPSHVLLGFSAKGDIVNYDSHMAGCGQRKGQSTAAELIRQSAKLVTLLDLAGHPKYLKTTMGGLVGQSPDYVVLTLDATTIPSADLEMFSGPGASGPGSGLGLGPMSDEHLRIALALELDLVVVVTKLDTLVGPEEKQAALSRVQDLVQSRLPGPSKRPMVLIRDAAAVTDLREQLALDEEATGDCKDMNSPVPVVGVSSVTGEGIDLLRNLLFHLPCRRGRIRLRRDGNETLVRVTDSFSVEDVGVVLAGTVQTGAVANGATLQLGPDREGLFQRVQVSSIHVNRVAVQSVTAGHAATFAIRGVPDVSLPMGGDCAAAPSTPSPTSSTVSEEDADEDDVTVLHQGVGQEPAAEQDPSTRLSKPAKRRGMVLLGSCSTPKAVYEFDADVVLLEHPGGSIKVDYEPIVHIHTIAQSAKITSIFSAGTSDPPPSSRSRNPPQDGIAAPSADLDASILAAALEPIALTEETRIHSRNERSARTSSTNRTPFDEGELQPAQSGPLLRGQRASVRFRFVYKPEYVSPGDSIVFREACMRGVGTVTCCFFHDPRKEDDSASSNARRRSRTRPN